MAAGGNPGRCVSGMQLVRATAVDIRRVPGDWPLPAAMRAAVATSWQEQVGRNPHLWDGRILGLCQPIEMAGGMFRAEAREDAYSAFMTWRALGFPDIGIAHVFCWAMIVSGDGAILYGRMGGQTANAGKVYPPGGSLEPRDVMPDGRVDVDRAIALELAEETGLSVADARAGAMLAVLDGPMISFGRIHRFEAEAEALRAGIRANLASQEHRELEDVVIIRSTEEARAAAPVPYALAVADAFFGARLV